MSSPLEQAILAYLGSAPKRFYAPDIQSKLHKQGISVSRDEIIRALGDLGAQGLVSEERPGWRLVSRIRTAPVKAPSVAAIVSARPTPQVSTGPVRIPASVQPLPSPADHGATKISDDIIDDDKVVATVDGGHWQSLRRLLRYYQDCLVMEDAPEIRGFIDSIHEQWLPIIGQVPWQMLGADRAGFSVNLRRDQGVFQANRARRGEDMSLYLGYPVKVVKSKQKPDEAFVVPIFVQPVEADWQANAIQIKPEGQPTVNAAWASYAFKEKGERAAFLSLVGLGSSEEPPAPGQSLDTPNLQQLGERMSGWFGDAVQGSIQPMATDQDETYANVEAGIHNRVVLMLGPRLKYTRSLLRELRSISAWSDEDIEQSSLRFIFPRDTPDPGSAWPWRPHPTGLHAEAVLMTNVLFGAQRNAVVSANSMPVTVVTGPPGTGKSEVVRAVLTNQLIRGRPTLMASRNHGAIDAVVPRLNELGGGEPVVIRASSPDIRARNDWKEQLRSLLSRPAQDRTQIIDAHVESVVLHAAELAREAKRLLHQAELASRYEEIALRHENAQARFPMEMAARDEIIASWDLGHTQTLTDLQGLLAEPQASPTWWMRFLNRILGRRQPDKQAKIDQLAATLPSPANRGHITESIHLWKTVAEINESLSQLQVAKRAIEQIPSAPKADNVRSALAGMQSHLIDLLKLLAGGAAGIHLDQKSRQRLLNLRAGIENFSGARFTRELRDACPQIIQAFPLWAVTNLSVKSTLPLVPGLYDLVVIDEASQCDIPSVIPLLARSRRAMIVGDPMQLSHITKMQSDQERLLLSRHGLEDFSLQRFSYRVNSAYALAEAAPTVISPILLDVHLRCHADIADFAGETFYRGGLRVGTDHSRLRAPAGMTAGIHWTDVVGLIEPAPTGAIAPKEILACERILKELAQNNYNGTIGVVTPFRMQANRIQDAIERSIPADLLRRWDFLSSTAHGFQGDERDLMLYSLCGGEGLPATSAGWFASQDGRCLMNVAVTRARAVLHIVGNQSWAESCGIPHIASLARSCRHRVERTEGSSYESPWEQRFDQALRAAGISTILQHPVAHRRLDIAVIDPVKLDIEVDGEAFHR